MPWKITHDDLEIDEVRSRAGLKTKGFPEGKIPSGSLRFRIYDDDGVLYYRGVLVLPPEGETERVMFAPLDWARADAGCTEIRYRNPETGKYETL